MSSGSGSTGAGLAAAAIVVALIALYVLPAIVAGCRHHRQGPAIAILNLFLGWTLIGWVAALVWACTDQRRPVTTTVVQTAAPSSASKEAEDIARFAKLRDDGLITAEEFEVKKRAILGLS